MLIQHSIGPFRFLNLTPCPPSEKLRVFTETRNGVDGFATWWEATRGEVYRPATVVDQVNNQIAQELKRNYEDWIGSVVTVVYAGVPYPNFLIKDVSATIQDAVMGIGGVNSVVGALVEARWDLLLLSEEEE